MDGFPTSNEGVDHWSTQPNCHTFGINTPYPHAKTRFGWTANQEGDCESNDTAIGLGVMDDVSGMPRGAGYECLVDPCSAGVVDAPGNGLLWAR